MKRTIATVSAIVLGITLLSGRTALAEAPEVSPSPVVESAVKENDYFSWIGDGMHWIRETYTAGKNAIVGGTEWLIESMKEWNGTMLRYLDEKKSSPEVQEAWNTLKEGAEYAGKYSKEAVTEAYQTVRDWMQGEGEAVDQEAASALDQMAAAAGVEEAELAEWYRTVENFVTSNAEKMTESTKEAWRVMKEANIAGAKIVKEEVMEAYGKVRDWVIDFGTESAETAGEALDHIMAEIEENS